MSDSVPTTKLAPRMAYLDNLRSLVMFLVVAMHSNVTYSGLGGWYYVEGRFSDLDTLSAAVFALYGSFCQSWFMGVLFFLAAYFAAKSLAKKGPGPFVRERLFRLGLPLLLYMLLIEPFIGYFLMNYDGIRDSAGLGRAYLSYLSSFDWLEATGPLWFAEALLLFCLPYALYRSLRPRRNDSGAQVAPDRAAGTAGSPTKASAVGAAPTSGRIALIALGTGLLAFCIRLFQPIGTDIANLQLGYFGAYIVLFVMGIRAGERGWLDSFPPKRGLRWFAACLGIGIPLWFALMIFGGAFSGEVKVEGGLAWQAFAYALWESFIAIGFSLGIVAFFKRFANVQTPATRLVADNSFGIYMFHAPVLVGVALILKDWQAPLLLKHLVVAPAAFALTLALSALVLKRIPGLRSVLK